MMEETKQIGTVARTRLSNAAHLNMNQEIHPMLTILAIADQNISNLQMAYDGVIAKEQECVNRITKSANTEQMEQMDAARDTTFRFMTNLIVANDTCPTEAIRLAAKRLGAIFSAYHGLSDKAFSEETAGIGGLLNDLKSETARDDLKVLHLEDFAGLLARQNEDYRTLDITRTNEYAARVKVETAEARKATDAALDTIVLRVNAMQVMKPTADTASLIDAVNQIYKKYSDLISAKAGHGKKPDAPIV